MSGCRQGCGGTVPYGEHRGSRTSAGCSGWGPAGRPERRSTRNGRPGFDGDKKAGKAAPRRAGGRAGRPADEAVGARATPAATGGCCWCCRGWTPPARAVSSSTRSACSTRAACGSSRSARRPRRSSSHDFLWRVEKETPGRRARSAIFDRSHYEDVLIGKVRTLAPDEEIERRYDAINDFERRLTEDGTTIVKCMLHISAGGAAAAAAGPARRARRSGGSSSPRTSTSGRTGTSTRRPTRSVLERCSTEWAPVVRRTEQPEVVPHAGDRERCCGTSCGPWTSRGRTATTTSRSRSAAAPRLRQLADLRGEREVSGGAGGRRRPSTC